MRTYLFIFLAFFIPLFLGFSSDYSFTITGELPVNKLNPPSDIFRFSTNFRYLPEKRRLELANAPAVLALSLNPPAKSSEIVFIPEKSITLITIYQSSPEKMEEPMVFFDPNQLVLIQKPLKFTLNDQKTGGITVSLLNRKEFQIPEISYSSKARTYRIPTPPKIEMVELQSDRIYLMEEGIRYNPMKDNQEELSRLSFGTSDLDEYRIGFSNPFLDAMISNQAGHLFLKNESVYIGAQASSDQMTGLAYVPGFDFKVDLFQNNFVLRSVTDFQLIPSFDFGLALFNTTPLPVINWYTTGSTNLFSIGVDVFARSAYGLEIRLKNDPFIIRGATGYNFSTDGFHAMVDGKYTFNHGLFNASLAYNDGISVNFGAAYQLIRNHPFSMNIYGNIDYQKDWLFSAGTKMRLGDVDLNVKIKFITGGLSVDVEAGYSF